MMQQLVKTYRRFPRVLLLLCGVLEAGASCLQNTNKYFIVVE
jgi:hypothetical protein